MSRKMIRAVLSLALLAFAPLVFAGPKLGNYAIDPSHSKVGFEIGHLVISSVEGRFRDFNGTMMLTSKGPQVKVVVDVASINTEEPRRDKHLRSPDFFDVAKFPTMTFENTKVTGDINKNFELHGTLNLHGVSRPLVLKMTFLGQAKDPWGTMRYAYKATGTLNRKDFGLNWNKVVEVGPLVGDEVQLSLKLELLPSKAK